MSWSMISWVISLKIGISASDAPNVGPAVARPW
jgi:hypothetical protein